MISQFLHVRLVKMKRMDNFLFVRHVCVCVFSCARASRSGPTLCNAMDCSPPGSSVYRILQARLLEWAGSSFFRRSSQPRNWTQVSRTVARCFTDWAIQEAPLLHLRNHKMWNVACQPLLFMGFSREGYWSELPFSSPGDLPNLGIQPRSPAL